MRAACLSLLLLTACPPADTADTPIDSGTDATTDTDGTEVEPDTERPGEQECDNTIFVDEFPMYIEGLVWADRTDLAEPDVTYVMNRSCWPGGALPTENDFYGTEIRYEVYARAGETIRLQDPNPDRTLVRNVYWQSGCDPLGGCLYAANNMSNGFPTRFIAPADGNYVVVVEALIDGASYAIELDVLPPEDCFDGLDNDDNGAIDCFDVRCGDVADCFGECDSLPFERPVTAGTRPRQSWWTTELDMQGDNCFTSIGNQSRAAVVAVDLQAGERIMARKTGFGGVPIYVATEDCRTGACLPRDPKSTVERGYYTAPEDATYFVVFYGTQPNPVIDFGYEVAIVTDEDCTTTEDDDRDGEGGCRDRDCIGHPSCPAFCPDQVTELPVTLTGGSWTEDYANLWSGIENGCGADAAGDAVFLVDLVEGDVLQMRGIAPTGPEDRWVLNIMPAGAATCDVFGPRDDCVSSGRFSRSVTVPQTGTYYVFASNMGLFGDAYEVVLEVQP